MKGITDRLHDLFQVLEEGGASPEARDTVLAAYEEIRRLRDRAGTLAELVRAQVDDAELWRESSQTPHEEKLRQNLAELHSTILAWWSE